MSTFANLHVHSEGSFLDGYSRVSMIAKRVKGLGQSAVALTDHGDVGQHLAFQKACLAEGVKPLLGMEGYWAPDIQGIRDFCKGENSGKWGAMMSHICLIAQDNEGLRNLWALSSTAYDKQHFYQRPIADPALLRQYATGLYASDGCNLTAFGKAVKAGDEDAARQYLAGLQAIFRERFYVELHTWQFMSPSTTDMIPWEGELISTVAVNQIMSNLNAAKVRLATEMGIPMVVVNDAHHAFPEHWQLREMICNFKRDANPDQQAGRGQKADHLMDDAELYLYMDRHGISSDVVAEAIKYSGEIAEQCHAEITPMLGLPRFTQSEADDFERFLDLVERGFRDKVERGGLDRERYRTRLESEVGLISEKHFAGYFLMVEDLVRAARSGSWAQYVLGTGPQPVDVGPGRGSAGGSLVAWLMGITELDPIKYGLLFERFLSPGRKGFPDIDLDFQKSKRPGMKQYLQYRWGEDRVCSVCTMSRNQAKGTVNDLARALDIDYGDGQAISKLIETITAAGVEEEESAEDAVLSWEEIVAQAGLGEDDLGRWIRKYPELFDKLSDLTGIIRQTGVHAAAVLIADRPLHEVLPTRVKNNTLTTQFDMYDVEELGGLKMDLLALRHLDALAIARDLVFQRHGVRIDYASFDEEQYADPAIWTQIDEGQTVGIFQLGTPGGTDSAIEFKPRSERDVSDLIAINRPGVRDAGLYYVYLRRRAGVEPLSYDHPLMESIVGDTFGVLIYQEQLMQTARELAGFTADEADDLRKAVSKKNMDKVRALKDKFITGCSNNPDYALGCGDAVNQTLDEKKERQVAEKIWGSMEASGKYLFNKSHAMGYSLITSRETWMKHYYPAEMLVGFMQVDEEKRNRYIRDARRKGFTMLPPDINISAPNFTITDTSIRYGLMAVHGVGESAAEVIVAGQPYTSFPDYLARAQRGAYKSAVVPLIKIGALDALGDRAKMLKEFERRKILDDVAPAKRAKLTREQEDEIVVDKLARYPNRFLIEVPDFDSGLVVYQMEQELVGSFVTIDPMGRYVSAIEANCIRNPAILRRYLPGQHLAIGGQLTKVRRHVVKRGFMAGETMAFLGVQWQGDDYDIVAFPRVFKKFDLLLQEGAPVVCECERQAPRDGQDGGVSLVNLYRLDLVFDEVVQGGINGQ